MDRDVFCDPQLSVFEAAMLLCVAPLHFLTERE